MNKQLRGSLILLLAAFVWGIAFVAQSAGMEHVGPFTFNSIRTLLGGIVLIPVVLFTRRKDMPIREAVHTARFRNSVAGGIVCGMCLCVASSLQQFGISMTTAGKAGFITALYIVIVPVLGIFTRHRVPKLVWFAVLIATAGFYLLSIHEGFTLSRGDFLVLLCAFAFSLDIIAVDHYSSMDVNCVFLSCIQFFVAGGIMLIAMFIFEKPVIADIRAAWLTIGYAGIMSAGVGYTLQIIGQRDVESTTASLIMSLESVFAALSGWIILHESMSLRELGGCAMVFLAVILAQLPAPEQKPKS